MQRHAQLMYTSCGWFFDDISGIETVQVIAYAARVLQLAGSIFRANRPRDLESDFLRSACRGQVECSQAVATARSIYKEKRRPHGTGPGAGGRALRHQQRVFTRFAEETELFCYRVRRMSYDIYTSGRGRLGTGTPVMKSVITGSAQAFSFAVLHFGDQNITAAVNFYDRADADGIQCSLLGGRRAGARADFPDAIRLIDRYYGPWTTRSHRSSKMSSAGLCSLF